MKRRKNKYKKDKYGQIEGVIDSKDDNLFYALREVDNTKEDKITQDKGEQSADKQKQSTKEWVTNSFHNENSSTKVISANIEKKGEENHKKVGGKEAVEG